MKSCNKNYIGFESELCALKKIRGELYKMQGGATQSSMFFVDCKEEKWKAEECSKKCGGGTQKLMRGLVTGPNGGRKCLPRTAEVKCNEHPCPVDCRSESWTGWSKCSAECGGGVQQRLRVVTRAAKYEGTPCPATSETRQCNPQSCEKDCVLSKWSKWSSCSKRCDGGTRKRRKWVVERAEGEGKCAGPWDSSRLQYERCAMHRCPVFKNGVIECSAQLDVIMLLDSSGSLRKSGWNAELMAANNFLLSFDGNSGAKKPKTQLSVISYSGPFTWRGVRKCTRSSRRMDLRKCKIQMVTHFTEDIKKVRQLVNGLPFMRGGTLTSLALSMAKEEFKLGRKNAKSVALVFTDGRPLYYGKTRLAAREVRKVARLMWVPITRRVPLAYIKALATRRWQENMVLAPSYRQLQSKTLINHIVADMCPPRYVNFGRN